MDKKKKSLSKMLRKPIEPQLEVDYKDIPPKKNGRSMRTTQKVTWIGAALENFHHKGEKLLFVPLKQKKSCEQAMPIWLSPKSLPCQFC
jgi:hypothetical protein